VPPDIDLYLRLDELLKIAERAGKPAAWCEETASMLAVRMRELEDLRLNSADPRRRKTLQEAARVGELLERARRQGYIEPAARQAVGKQLGFDKWKMRRLIGWLHEVAHPAWSTLGSQRRKRSA
jgi:hypothetical protein